MVALFHQEGLKEGPHQMVVKTKSGMIIIILICKLRKQKLIQKQIQMLKRVPWVPPSKIQMIRVGKRKSFIDLRQLIIRQDKQTWSQYAFHRLLLVRKLSLCEVLLCLFHFILEFWICQFVRLSYCCHVGFYTCVYVCA